jgi:murein DD-endopeptidase MepM/ murein hydrolase activator NlpD
LNHPPSQASRVCKFPAWLRNPMLKDVVPNTMAIDRLLHNSILEYLRQNYLVLLLLTLFVGLLLVAVITHFEDEKAPDLNAGLMGVGGPAEKSLAQLMLESGELRADSPDPAFLVRDPGFVWMDRGELGPLFRRDDGPLEMRIASGQTFYEALAAREVAHEDIMALVRACKGFRNLRKVRAGEVFRVHITSDGGLRSLGFDLDEESHVVFMREGDTYVRQDFTYPVEHRLMAVGGTIDISLYASLQELGAPLDLAPKMSDILGWDIDFTRDLRKGDTFRIAYEEVWKDGKRVRVGRVLATEMVNRNKSRAAYLFTSEDGRPGYYDEKGNNLAKTLMRAPLEYSRISSHFSYRRFHPVLKRWMPHLGVDYAAPLGTPVRAAGDGTIQEAGRKKGNGRYIRIRHTNSEYETYYLHLSRFAEGMKKGKKVSQGQVIGYVGATGYATGPHLDFRVKRNGKFVNPRRLKLPAAAPVSDELKERFSSMTARYASLLDGVQLGGIPTLLPPLQPAEAPREGPVLTRAKMPVGIGAPSPEN